MTIEFDRGATKRPWTRLVETYPDSTVYPVDAFRVEWGPIFHRGRLDGSARVLIIGQDPATHETICRRILVGEAGQRIQGFLSKLGIVTSYLMINTFLYSVYGQGGGERHIDDPGITEYRNKWINAAVDKNGLEAIITLGHLAGEAVDQWAATPEGAASTIPVVRITHPTFPESASRSNRPGHPTKAQAMAQLCQNWNTALAKLRPIVTPDEPRPLVKYGATITDEEHTAIPPIDLPAGFPSWMRSLKSWAVRVGADTEEKRATIKVTVPRTLREWHV